MSRLSRLHLVALAALSFTLAPPGPAHAQASAPAAPAAAASAPATPSTIEPTLPAIKATATPERSTPLGYLRKEDSAGALGNKPVLDTPFSVTVIDSREIAERGARSIGQIFINDPSVYTPTNSASTDWWGTQIRGLGVRNMYVDDVPMLLYWGGDFATEAVDSVSALKGLTGFMYGFGEPGGALSYRLKRPTALPETSVTLGWRNPGLFSAHLDTSHRLGTDLAIRANLATEHGEAYNAATIKRSVASLAVDKDWGASLKWQTTLLYEDSKNTGEPIQFYIDGYDVAGSGGKLPDPTYRYDDINVDNSYYKSRTLLASTALQWRIDDRWTMKTQLGFTRKDHFSNKSFANLLNRAGDYEGNMYNFAGRLDNQFAQSMLQGTVTTGAVKHDLVGGFGLQRATDRWGREWYWEHDFDGNLYVEQPFRVTRMPDFTLEPVSADTRQRYAFLSDTLHFGPRWQAILGLRHTRYEMRDSYRTNASSPTLALIYKPDARTSVYGSYVEGLEPGTRVGPPYANAGELLGATVSRQVEIGVKHDAGDLAYTAALFQIQRANQIDELRGTDRYLTQDGRLDYRGVELAGSLQLTRQLNLGLGAVFLDAAIRKVSPGNADLEGNVPANASRWQLAGHAEYTVPGVAGLKLHGGWRYFGSTYAADTNTLKVPARTVLNAGFSWDFALHGRLMTLHGNVYNLLNEKYWASGGWGSGNVGEARNAALTLTAQF